MSEVTSRELPDWLDAHLQATDNSEPPELFRLWCGISTLAAALERKVSLDWGPVYYPNMYIVLVAPAGRARKGTAMRPAQKYLTNLGTKLAASTVTREALIQTLEEAQDMIMDNHDKPYSHASLTIFSPELTVFLGYNNMQLMSDLTDWFDCADRWEYRTKNAGTSIITGVYINLIGATTPDLIRSALPTDAVGGGLTSRMIFVYEENKGKLVPLPFLSQEDRLLTEKLNRDLSRINLMKGKFKATAKFVSFYTDWYVAQSRKPPRFYDKSFDGYIERRPTHILKLSMILSASHTDSLVVDEPDIRRAVEILERTEKKMSRAFGGMGSERNASVLNDVMVALSFEQNISIQELLRRHWHDISKEDLEKVIDTLVCMGVARRRITTDGISMLTFCGWPQDTAQNQPTQPKEV